mmetsp:Transcript_38941/g.97852  ORF Transcript_38941/g.97852 Transcript_38941/m.97852 type:complete len:334 (-) Transcript_38941:98-1099(-)
MPEELRAVAHPGDADALARLPELAHPHHTNAALQQRPNIVDFPVDHDLSGRGDCRRALPELEHAEILFLPLLGEHLQLVRALVADVSDTDAYRLLVLRLQRHGQQRLRQIQLVAARGRRAADRYKDRPGLHLLVPLRLRLWLSARSIAHDRPQHGLALAGQVLLQVQPRGVARVVLQESADICLALSKQGIGSFGHLVCVLEHGGGPLEVRLRVARVGLDGEVAAIDRLCKLLALRRHVHLGRVAGQNRQQLPALLALPFQRLLAILVQLVVGEAEQSDALLVLLKGFLLPALLDQVVPLLLQSLRLGAPRLRRDGLDHAAAQAEPRRRTDRR